MYTPSFDEFCEKAKKGNLIPVYREILADLETPVSAFLKIQDGTLSYLLESVEGEERWARYSFLGNRPSVVFQAIGDRVVVQRGRKRAVLNGVKDPLVPLQQLMAEYQPVEVDGIPRFHGGAVGYMSYDAVRYFERLPSKNPDTLKVPDLYFLITDTILAFDHVRHRLLVISNAHIRDGDLRTAYRTAVDKIERTVKRLRRPLRPSARKRHAPLETRLRANMPKEAYLRAVERAKEYIRAGDIFQVVPSYRLSTRWSGSGMDLYRALRGINPSPYLYYLDLGKLKLIGSSPELMVRLEDGQVQVRPIAGTYRRGATKEEDEDLARKLLSDEKERAEHIMLVDLGRNDLGRVSRYRSVSVDRLTAVEKYSHVMHIVSNVTGRLQPGKDAFDVLRACFPAGTLTGAPKIRAMEIIEELEVSRRGPYAGAVGYISFSGNMDTCIAIRTMALIGRRLHIQAGAGVVADSVPEKEYEETRSKMKALLAALDRAEQGLE
jgi:anthranilate synthase component 1